jgi:hypothetical protein
MDLRRRSDFADRPSWFLQECEALGLFQTRMPRFPQLFFYNFSEMEVVEKQGQSSLGPSVTQWSSMGWLLSHPRLESKSGMSDVLYWHLEGSFDKNQKRMHVRRRQPPPAHPRLHSDHLRFFTGRLRWTLLSEGGSAIEMTSEEEISGANEKEGEFWLETGEGGRENRPKSSLVKKLASAIPLEEEEDYYVPSSVPEEQELRIRK